MICPKFVSFLFATALLLVKGVIAADWGKLRQIGAGRSMYTTVILLLSKRRTRFGSDKRMWERFQIMLIM